MNLPRRKSVFLHRRILIVFLFSIVLPGAYIGYRGLRSVVQEQELQRAILLQSLERTLAFEIDKFERTLKESAESSARALIAVKSLPTLPVIDDFAESRPWIEDVFLYDAQLNLRGPPSFAPKLHLDGKPLVSEQSVREKADVAARFEIREFIPLTLVGVTSPTLGTQWVAFVVRPDQIEREFLLPALQAGDWAKEFLVSVRQDTSDIPNRHDLFNSRMHETAVWFPFLKVAVSPRSLSTVEILGIRSPLFVSIGLASLILGVLVLGIFIIYRDIRREEELSMMKSEFISNVSHELKTPIAAIRMLADNSSGGR